MWDKITLLSNFPLLFGNMCLGAQYLDTKFCSLLLLLLLLLLLFIQKVKLQNNGIFHAKPFEKNLLLYSCISNV